MLSQFCFSVPGMVPRLSSNCFLFVPIVFHNFQLSLRGGPKKNPTCLPFFSRIVSLSSELKLSLLFGKLHVKSFPLCEGFCSVIVLRVPCLTCAPSSDCKTMMPHSMMSAHRQFVQFTTTLFNFCGC